jgi:hypothetical protein
MFKVSKLFSAKIDIEGKWVAVMKHSRNDRSMKLGFFQTRCLKREEIHEFIVCDREAEVTSTIDNVAYLGFGEITQGGVVEVGDCLYCGETIVGQVVGFDETHLPNHFNIIIQGESLATGYSFGLKPMDSFFVRQNT